jgi:hypothetical protein
MNKKIQLKNKRKRQQRKYSRRILDRCNGEDIMSFNNLTFEDDNENDFEMMVLHFLMI